MEEQMVPQQGGMAGQPISIAYSGAQMTKMEVMAFLYEAARYQKEFKQYEGRKAERDKRLQTLEVQVKGRRTFPKETPMQPPSELPRFSTRRRREYQARQQREYQTWLAEAPMREEARQRKQAEEDARIEGLKKQYSDLQSEALEDAVNMNVLAAEYKDLLAKQVIAPDYQKFDVPEMLLMYLFNARANTLAEAINIYHEEMYRMEMRSLAEQQRQEARAAQRRQAALAMQQLEAQREQAAHLLEAEKSAKAARAAAENAEMLAWIDLLSR